MSLRRQLFLVLSILFLIVLMVILGYSLSGTRRFLEQQLASHAQDAATAMSLTLVQSLSKNDRVLAEAQVMSVFDRGYFKRVDVLAADRTPVVSKELPEKIEGVPIWFSQLLPIVTPQGEAHISSGWRQLGKVLVVSQPTFAYQYLWRTAVDMWLWITGIYVGALLLMQLLLRFILQPLGLIERSALAVQRKQFEQIPIIPKAPELARVVNAMNDMSRRVAAMLDEDTARADVLRRQAFIDEQTGLANRRSFEMQLKGLLEGDYKFELAAMILVDLDDLHDYMRLQSFPDGLEVLRIVARSAQAVLKGDHVALLARSKEYTFCFVVAGLSAEEIAALASSLHELLVRDIANSPAGGRVAFDMGVAYFHQDDKRADIFARADFAMESAQHEGRNGLFILPEKRDAFSSLGSFGWRALIQSALKDSRWLLMAQPVVKLANREEILHGEIMARMVNTKGELLPASQFLPMAERHHLMSDIDQSLVKLALDYLKEAKWAAHFAINLSPQSAANREFLVWLGDKLAELKSNAACLSFELSEFGCLRDVGAARQLMGLVRQHGATFGIDHFGLDPQALILLRQIPPDYVKLNGGLVGAMESDEDSIAVVRSIVQLAHSLDVQVIAQNVESEPQVAALLAVSVDGGQGYLFGAPG